MDPLYHLHWHDDAGLPEIIITAGTGHPEAHHPVAGWRLKANVYFDGSVRPFSAEFGSRFFTPAPFHAQARHATCDGVVIDMNRLAGERRVAPGRFLSRMAMRGGHLHLTVVLPDLDSRRLLMQWHWEGPQPAPQLCLPVDMPDVTAHGTSLGVDLPYYGRVSWTATGHNVSLANAAISADLSTPLTVAIGYDPTGQDQPPATPPDVPQARATSAQEWRDILARQSAPAGAAGIELRWEVARMIATAVFDGTRQRLCATNGALYAFNHRTPDLDQSNGMYSFRDGNQVALAAAFLLPRLARDQILRSVEAFTQSHGIPQMSTAHPEKPYLFHAPGGGEGSAAVAFASEQVWWWLLAYTELALHDPAVAGLRVRDHDGVEATLAEQAQRLIDWTDRRVGDGPHGLNRFLSGDWNDWLGRIGQNGRGESFMNLSLEIVGRTRLAALLTAAGDTAAATRHRDRVQQRRTIAASLVTGQAWFPRAFDDAGALVGGERDRLYLDGVTWAVLAHLGTPEDRRRALDSALARCLTPIGPTLIDRGLGPHECSGRTHCTYPPGAGENAGIWWIAGWWLAMALDQEGRAGEADAVAASCSPTNHHRHYPQLWWSPFMNPDGIDGPESPLYGAAQHSGTAYGLPPDGGCDRESNPNEVAKVPFQSWFHSHRGHRLAEP